MCPRGAHSVDVSYPEEPQPPAYRASGQGASDVAPVSAPVSSWTPTPPEAWDHRDFPPPPMYPQERTPPRGETPVRLRWAAPEDRTLPSITNPYRASYPAPNLAPYPVPYPVPYPGPRPTAYPASYPVMPRTVPMPPSSVPVPYGSPPGYLPVPFYGYQRQPTSGLCVASLVLGLLGLGLVCCDFGVLSLVAVVLGHLGLSQARNGDRGGRGMGIAGLILGYVVIVPAFFVSILVLGNAVDARR
jgi:hypothetical protein